MERLIDRMARAAYESWCPRGEPFTALPDVIQRDWRRLVLAVLRVQKEAEGDDA